MAESTNLILSALDRIRVDQLSTTTSILDVLSMVVQNQTELHDRQEVILTHTRDILRDIRLGMTLAMEEDLIGISEREEDFGEGQ